MEKTMNLFFIILILLISGCDMFNTDKKEPEPEVKQYFRAEVNGESWSGVPRAVLSNLGDLPWFSLYAIGYDSTKWPYSEDIGFSIHFNSEESEYNVIREPEENGRTSGAYFVESDGDATIARYEPIPDSINTLIIHLEKMGNEKELVTGTFSMKVAIDPRYDNEYTNGYRQQPDTVRITNGEFRVLLEEQE